MGSIAGNSPARMTSVVGSQLRRLGMVMEPEPGNFNEVEGVLNPTAARGPNGKLYLFPRLVGSCRLCERGNLRDLLADPRRVRHQSMG